jgi:hypothetical protein
MNLFKVSTLALALALIGWGACSSSNNNTDVQNIGGTIATGGVTGTGGAGGAVADAGDEDGPSVSPPDSAPDIATGTDVLPVAPNDGGSGDICTGLTPQQCHLAIINATLDLTVSALDPGANPPVPYPTCSAQ